MLAFLKLIRFPNLLIIVATQYAIRWGIIYPIITNIDKALYRAHPERFQKGFVSLQLSELDFFLVVLSTVLIAAAGYIINDYFDVKMDKINKPDEVVVGKSIHRRFAILAHTALNIIAISIATWIGYKIGIWKIGIIYFICAGGLWYYSTNFKRQVFIGNLLIAIFTALVPLIVALFELPLIIKEYESLIIEFNININRIIHFTLGFSFFAFATTLIREIIKDIEDMEGDDQYGCDTLPIKYGITKTKRFIALLLLASMAALAYIQYTQLQFNAITSVIYLLIAIQVPFVLLLITVLKGKKPEDFKLPSRLTKIIMLLGVFYTVIIYYSFT